jgi:hypothetical protein
VVVDEQEDGDADEDADEDDPYGGEDVYGSEDVYGDELRSYLRIRRRGTKTRNEDEERRRGMKTVLLMRQASGASSS